MTFTLAFNPASEIIVSRFGSMVVFPFLVPVIIGSSPPPALVATPLLSIGVPEVTPATPLATAEAEASLVAKRLDDIK